MSNIELEPVLMAAILDFVDLLPEKAAAFKLEGNVDSHRTAFNAIKNYCLEISIRHDIRVQKLMSLIKSVLAFKAIAESRESTICDLLQQITLTSSSSKNQRKKASKKLEEDFVEDQVFPQLAVFMLEDTQLSLPLAKNCNEFVDLMNSANDDDSSDDESEMEGESEDTALSALQEFCLLYSESSVQIEKLQDMIKSIDMFISIVLPGKESVLLTCQNEGCSKQAVFQAICQHGSFFCANCATKRMRCVVPGCSWKGTQYEHINVPKSDCLDDE